MINILKLCTDDSSTSRPGLVLQQQVIVILLSLCPMCRVESAVYSTSERLGDIYQQPWDSQHRLHQEQLMVAEAQLLVAATLWSRHR